MSYKDKTFCPESDRNDPKCLSCDRFFDEQEYLKACDRTGYKIPVAWFLEPPCEKRKESAETQTTASSNRFNPQKIFSKAGLSKEQVRVLLRNISINS